MLGKGERKTESSIRENSRLMREQLASHRSILVMFLGMLAFKIASDAGYLWLSTQDRVYFPLDFSLLKYVVGLICCIAIFVLIRHDQRKSSTFFLYFVFLFQIVPITSVYAMANESTEFYLVLVISYLLCVLVTGYTVDTEKIRRNVIISKAFVMGFAGVMALVVLVLLVQFGLPSLGALNIYSVYELRSSGTFVLGKYLNYLFTWTTAVILPAGIAWCITKRKYILMLVFCGLMLMMYLYSGHKTFLFSIPLVVICTFWSRRKNFYKELFTVGSFGFLLLVVLVWFSPILKDLFQRVFSLLARRVLLLSANNKFKYFDYFSNHPKMGLGGIFPRWLLYIPNHYENIPYSYEISAIYYNKPEMNSNTGFLAEGFMRFGHLGTVGILLLFAVILKQIDNFQLRSDYSLAVGLFVYQIFSLSDAHLLDSMVLGPWMLLVLFLLFYNSGAKKQGEGMRHIPMLRFRLCRRSGPEER